MDSVILFATLRHSFFATPCKLNCGVREFCAFPGADRLAGVLKTLQGELVDVGLGVSISKPVSIPWHLRSVGTFFYASVSPHGVVAVCSVDDKSVVQFTDLFTNAHTELEVEGSSLAAFFDRSLILLTWGCQLRVGVMAEVLESPSLDTLRELDGTGEVVCWSDVSLVHATRTLCYLTTAHEPHEFNVDSEKSRAIGVERKVWAFASMTGIHTGVRAVFQEAEGGYNAFALLDDGTVSIVHPFNRGCNLVAMLPSASNPTDLSQALGKYKSNLVASSGERLRVREPIRLEYNHSIVRLFQDVFLLLDMRTASWVLARVIVP